MKISGSGETDTAGSFLPFSGLPGWQVTSAAVRLVANSGDATSASTQTLEAVAQKKKKKNSAGTTEQMSM